MKKRLNFKGISNLIYATCFCLTGIITGCDMIEYHPYDLDIKGETGINAKNIERIRKATTGKKEIRFVVISDTQRWYDETNLAVDFINEMDSIDFVLHAGDISDFGLKMEFEKQRDILNKLKVPYVVIIGNHDCLGTGPEVFNRVFGENNYSFDAGEVHFVCLNTNALEFDHSVEVPDLDFLEKDLKNVPSTTKKTVFAMHAGPFSDQFNGNICDVTHLILKEFPGFQFGVYGHGHSRSVDEFFKDGITYYECACAKKREVLRFTINEEGYKYEPLKY